jgi:transcriptional regulator with XRE-family HTH domain
MGDRAKVTFPPFLQELLDRNVREGKRDTLLQLLRRAGITLTDEERGRIAACEDAATLDRWICNVLGAKTSADVFAEEAR